MANPPVATEEETAHQMTLGTKAQGTEAPDYPESPAPPHTEAPQQQRARQLAGRLEPPPPGQRSPHNILHIRPSYNKKTSDNETTTPLALTPTPLCDDSLISLIFPALHLFDP